MRLVSLLLFLLFLDKHLFLAASIRPFKVWLSCLHICAHFYWHARSTLIPNPSLRVHFFHVFDRIMSDGAVTHGKVGLSLLGGLTRRGALRFESRRVDVPLPRSASIFGCK